MTTKVDKYRTCDWQHKDEVRVNGNATVAFSFGTAAYEIDECDTHTGKAEGILGDLAGRATKVAVGPGVRGMRQASPAVRSRPKVGREQKAEVRRWVKERHPDVSDRGRIPEAYLQEWEDAHSA